jgi:23S rRNA U2552 (ribose-2'-O)-methylase RlmE/FtsJ
METLRADKEQGWNDPAGDVHYTNHHSKIDNARPEDKWKMYDDMAEIAREINNATSALTIPPRTSPAPDDVPVVLDLCMAPGGFTRTALELNPTAHVFGLSLPVNLGGQYLLIPPSPNITVIERDINLLAAEMGVSAEDIPPSHPDKARFDYWRYFDLKFEHVKADLVFCDGNNERTHEKLRAEYRKKEMETRRLNLAQLVFALSRIREGGTLVMLLHTPENMLQILYSISKFADIQLYKPTCHHAPKSSAYLVAKNVRPTHPEALRAVEWWKGVWRRITFDTAGVVGDGEGGAYVAMSEDTVDEVLEMFGERFMELARPAWRLQAEALATKNERIRGRKVQKENMKLEAPRNDKENHMRDAPRNTERNSKQEAIEGPDWRRNAKPPEAVEVPVWRQATTWRPKDP